MKSHTDVTIDAPVDVQNCQVNGYDVRCRVLGQGPPAVLLHGWGASWHYWQWLAPALARAGYRVYAPDLPGHGDSAKPPLPYGSETYHEFARGLAQALSLERFVLAGHSLGGYVALRLAETWPERVKRLVLVNPLCYASQLRLPLPALMRIPVLGELVLRLTPLALVNVAVRLSSLGRNKNVPRSFLRQAAIDYKRATPRIANPYLGRPDLRPDAARVTAPTLVAWGEKDAVLSPQSFRELVQMLPAGQAQTFPNAGHSPLVEEPAEFNRAVLRFLERAEE